MITEKEVKKEYAVVKVGAGYVTECPTSRGLDGGISFGSVLLRNDYANAWRIAVPIPDVHKPLIKALVEQFGAHVRKITNTSVETSEEIDI